MLVPNKNKNYVVDVVACDHIELIQTTPSFEYKIISVGPLIIDNIEVDVACRILLKNQNEKKQNFIIEVTKIVDYNIHLVYFVRVSRAGLYLRENDIAYVLSGMENERKSYILNIPREKFIAPCTDKITDPYITMGVTDLCWLPLCGGGGGGGGDVELINDGTDIEGDLVADGVGPVLHIRGLKDEAGISITKTDTDICIENTDKGSDVTLENAGTGGATGNLVNDGVGPELKTKGLLAGTGISLSNTATDITITNLNGLVTLGACENGDTSAILVDIGVAPDLSLYSLKAGDGIMITPAPSGEGGDDCNVCIINDDPGSAVTLINDGTDIEGDLVADGVGPVLHIRGLKDEAGISITKTDTDICIENTDKGSDVTLENAGTGGATGNLVNDGVGPELKTKGLLAGTGISLSNTATDITITNLNGLVTLGACENGDTSAILVDIGVAPDLSLYSLKAGDGIMITPAPSGEGGDDCNVCIINDDPGSAVTLIDCGHNLNHLEVVQDGIGPELGVVGLEGGVYVTLTENISGDKRNIVIDLDQAPVIGEGLGIGYSLMSDFFLVNMSNQFEIVAFFTWNHSKYSQFPVGCISFYYKIAASSSRDIILRAREENNGDLIIGTITITDNGPTEGKAQFAFDQNPIGDTRLIIEAMTTTAQGGQPPFIYGLQLDFLGAAQP